MPTARCGDRRRQVTIEVRIQGSGNVTFAVRGFAHGRSSQFEATVDNQPVSIGSMWGQSGCGDQGGKHVTCTVTCDGQD